MHVISRKKLVAFWEEQHDAEKQLAAWFKVAKKAKWGKWADVQKAYPKASYYECCLIFNICGGSYRLVVRRAENWKTLFIVGVYLHKEYDLEKWKDYCSCR
jgi:mRNA interferase HigB